MHLCQKLHFTTVLKSRIVLNFFQSYDQISGSCFNKTTKIALRNSSLKFRPPLRKSNMENTTEEYIVKVKIKRSR